jgi:hypothetical protein
MEYVQRFGHAPPQLTKEGCVYHPSFKPPEGLKPPENFKPPESSQPRSHPLNPFNMAPAAQGTDRYIPPPTPPVPQQPPMAIPYPQPAQCQYQCRRRHSPLVHLLTPIPRALCISELVIQILLILAVPLERAPPSRSAEQDQRGSSDPCLVTTVHSKHSLTSGPLIPFHPLTGASNHPATHLCR